MEPVKYKLTLYLILMDSENEMRNKILYMILIMALNNSMLLSQSLFFSENIQYQNRFQPTSTNLNNHNPQPLFLIEENTYWSDTVIITSNVRVDAGSALTIDPGTYIEFQGYYLLEVYGRISAKGTEDAPIVFTIKDTTGFSEDNRRYGSWRGINFIGPKSNELESSLNYCMIEFCKDIDFGLDDFGGAIHIQGYSPLEINNCTIRYCVSNFGAGILCQNANPIISSNVIYGNKAEQGGAAIYCYQSNPQITNNLIFNNSSLRNGGALVMQKSADVIILNNTITNNRAEGSGGGIYCHSASNPLIINTILYKNTARLVGNQIFFDENTKPVFRYCVVEGGTNGFSSVPDYEFDGVYEYCLEINPQFVDEENQNFRLSESSPCIDTGLNKPVDYELDLDNHIRIWDGNGDTTRIVDIGAFEFGAASPLEIMLESQGNESVKGVTNDGYIIINITGGLEPYIIRWNTGDTTNFITNLKYGYYVVTVTDQLGKTEKMTIRIDYDEEPVVELGQFTISGRVYGDDEIIDEGKVVAFKQTDDYFVPDTFAIITEGEFLLNFLDSARYILYAIPGPGYLNFMPTYYSNYINWNQVDIIDLNGRAYDVDLYLIEKQNLEIGTGKIAGYVVFEDSSVYENEIFQLIGFDKTGSLKSEKIPNGAENIPVLLETEERTLEWVLTDENGYFEFSGLPEGNYNLAAQKPGYSLINKPVLSIIQSNPEITNVTIVIRKKEILTNISSIPDLEIGHYPNPVKNWITFDFSYYKEMIFVLEIFDTGGRLLLKSQYIKPNGNTVYNVNLSEFANGLYIAKVSTLSTEKRFLFVKRD